MQDLNAAGPVGLTQGDPAGIGPDITIATWRRRHEHGLPPFLYIGDPVVLAERARLLDTEIRIRETDAAGAASVFGDAIPVLPVKAGTDVRAGHPDPQTAAGTIGAIETAVSLCLQGALSSVATNPIAKSVLYKAGFRFPGHTEFLADLATRAIGKPVLHAMMLAGPLLR